MGFCAMIWALCTVVLSKEKGMQETDNPLAEKSTAAVMWALQTHFSDEALLIEPYLLKLFQALNDGHSYIWLNTQDREVLLQAPHLVTTTPQAGLMPLVLMGNRLFLAKIWQLETDIGDAVLAKLKQKIDIGVEDGIAQALMDYFPDDNAKAQKQAAAQALLNRLMVIIGGPGTGKTTTVAKILLMLFKTQASQQLPSIALVAPTGKAAARMTEALHGSVNAIEHISKHEKDYLMQLQGMTLHRFLRVMPPKMQSPFNQHHPVPYDIVVVDEASMIDLSMMKNLLLAIGPSSRLIILGDAEQLPSVGAGAVLSALSQETQIYHGHLPRLKKWLGEGVENLPTCQDISLNMAVTTLTHSHRFGEHSGVGQLARLVLNQGNLSPCFMQFSAALQLQAQRNPIFTKMFEEQGAYWEAVAANNVAAAFTAMGQLLVLAVYRQDVEWFNQQYRQFLCEKGLASINQHFAGQMIMMAHNDYGLGVFNGDIAIVLADENQVLQAYFPHEGQFRAVSLSRLPAFDDAFAITVHKSQGSEAQSVWLLGPENEDTHSALFNKALLYTAITRAKEKFTYWGSMDSLQKAATNTANRRSSLPILLGGKA